MKKKKFIINDGRIIFGEVLYHSDLVRDNTKTVGGGLWFYDHLSDTMYLYGLSTDFGPVTREQVEKAWSFSLEGRTVIWSPDLTLEEALKSDIIIQQPQNAAL